MEMVPLRSAPEGLQIVARGQSDEGAATPGQENRKISKPQRGGSSFGRKGFAVEQDGLRSFATSRPE